MASAQPALQTIVLRVTIHCHGCKKKVRKVLKNIQGVQDVKVDAQQHKVTVTGTVDAETLVKRLYKSGKHALPWQHTPAAPANSPEAAPAPEAPAPAPPAEDSSKDPAAADKNPADPVKELHADSSDKKSEQEETSPEKKPETEKEAEYEKKAENDAAKPSDEANKDGDDGAATEPESESAAATKEAGDDEAEDKKKQSKPKNAPAPDRSLSPSPAPAHAQQEFNPYSAPQPVMSYHTAQPRASVSYYAPQPQQAYSQQAAQPMQQWSPSYLYMPYPHASPESYYQDYYSPPGTHAPPPPPPPPLQDSYRLFDDENPNSCSVM
ncbi:heavy metal-associated isoprenylated plant protein 35-like isoform X2 [Triticum dicoccoides]|uniref:heavy metal-associated isoprenylated plant protein 35-like isoform X2 n=1 Tax=Triticum dicoccoides TaxID=85692 RepID=UPI0018917464|nr:heavy metal-associated isoprenylated plant protein 35-like isoform X2 [Triticum dicoccoides]